MKFNVSSTLRYTVKGPGTLLLNIQPAQTGSQQILSEEIIVNIPVGYQQLGPNQNGSRLLRFNFTDPADITITCRATVETFFSNNPPGAAITDPGAIGEHIIPYLFPSRYCASDRIIKLAEDLFSQHAAAYETVMAIVNWIHGHIDYTSGITDEHSTGIDVLIGRQGVCRDFAHLAILFCRAVHIPARYFTGYAYQLQPQDFHACFEAYIGGEWLIFDATRLAPLNGLVQIATGLDAADTAFANIFGNIDFEWMEVSCELDGHDNFRPFFRE